MHQYPQMGRKFYQSRKCPTPNGVNEAPAFEHTVQKSVIISDSTQQGP